MIYSFSWLPVAGILVKMVKPWPNLFFKWELEPKHCNLISWLSLQSPSWWSPWRPPETARWPWWQADRRAPRTPPCCGWSTPPTVRSVGFDLIKIKIKIEIISVFRAWEPITIRITKVYKVVKSWTKIRRMINRDDQQIHQNQEKVSSMWSRPTYNGPQVPSCHRIHSCARLVEEDKRWFANLKIFLRTPKWRQLWLYND